VGDKSVQFFLSILIVVTLPREADTYAVRDIADTSLPDFLVKASIHSDIRGAHHFRGKLADFLDGARRLPLESISAELRVQVDGILTSDNFIALRLTIPGRLRLNGKV
jgi:hypothetical protein